MLGAGCLALIFASFTLPARVRSRPSTTPEQAIMASFVVANALGEGAGLVVALGYAVTQFSPLLVGLLASSLAMLAHRPSAQANRDWLRERERLAR